MIFHDLECIFFHIGKTAGTSVEHWLGARDQDALETDRDSLFGWDPELQVFLQHAAPGLVRSIVGQPVFESYYKFTIVRNPYVRLLSVFHYLDRQKPDRNGDFRDFVLSLPGLLEEKSVQNGAHILPQASYTHLDGEPVCDRIVYFEELPGSLAPVAYRLGMKSALPVTNVSGQAARTGASIASYYSDSMIATMKAVYALDFELFRYPRHPNKLDPLY